LLAGLCVVAPAPAALDNSDCFACHSDKALVRTNAAGRVQSLFVDEKIYATSVHRTNACVNCHTTIKDVPHTPKLPAVDCARCHEATGKEYATSIHGVSRAMGASSSATCKDCHGDHTILPVKHPASPVFKMNLAKTCARCHANPGLTAEYRMKHPAAAEHYQESIHGKALMQSGLIVAPSCNDCHGVHNIRRVVDRSSPIHHSNVADTCGKCHVGIEETYKRSVHGKLLLKGEGRGPVCNDCHSAHEIERPRSAHFKAGSDQRCGKCHQDRLEHYRETYHGKAMALGRPTEAHDVAACYDCHGHHDVLPPSDPKSHLSSANILGTCRKCHPEASRKFTQYVPHANHLDKKNYLLLHLTFVCMTGLLVGTFAVFGIHTLFWFVRSGYLYLHDSKTFREAKIEAQSGEEWFTRFQPFERFLHFTLVSSFLVLTITGMPLKFYSAHWARTMFNILGGAGVGRALHHLAATILLICFVLHLFELLGSIWAARHGFRNQETRKFQIKSILRAIFGPDSMLLTRQDWRDFVAHQKWFFGKGSRPQFDRWTYWEKFDYLAVFWGMFAIGLSGLVMWFPEGFTRILPGWIINIALVIHSDEALLAAGFIFTFHFFNTHFRLEKFPMDTVIFSGRISKAEMLHERKRWYDRLVAEGRLDEYRVKDEYKKWRSIHRSFGFVFFGIGLVLLLLIVYAMVSRLGHS
jgi:cytochrome b subunit of formate dehydrogenase